MLTPMHTTLSNYPIVMRVVGDDGQVGVGRACRRMSHGPQDAELLTMKSNPVEAVTDGSADLGLGNIAESDSQCARIPWHLRSPPRSPTMSCVQAPSSPRYSIPALPLRSHARSARLRRQVPTPARAASDRLPPVDHPRPVSVHRERSLTWR